MTGPFAQRMHALPYSQPHRREERTYGNFKGLPMCRIALWLKLKLILKVQLCRLQMSFLNDPTLKERPTKGYLSCFVIKYMTTPTMTSHSFKLSFRSWPLNSNRSERLTTEI